PPMSHTTRLLPISLLALCFGGAIARTDEPARPLFVTVKAGPYDRDKTPIRFEIPAHRLGPAVRKALEAGPAAVGFTVAPPPPGSIGAGGMAQVDRGSDDSRAVVTLGSFPVAKSQEIRYQLALGAPCDLQIKNGRVFGISDLLSFDETRPGA